MRYFEKGFTLLEIIIATSVASVTGILLMQLLVSSNSVFYSESEKVYQGLKINEAASIIEKDIKASSSVASGYPLQSPQYTTSPQTLILGIPSVNGSGNVIASVYDYIIYTKDGQNNKILRRLVMPDASSSRKGANQVLVTNLKQVIFYYYDSNNNVTIPTSAVKINYVINLAGNIGINPKSSSVSGEINIRND